MYLLVLNKGGLRNLHKTEDRLDEVYNVGG